MLVSDNVLPAHYFARDVVAVARDLIGRTLRVVADGRVTCAMVVETEAYGGSDDPASHAAFRPGGRAAIMAGEPGRVYVYAAYGMYPCFNIVTGPIGHPSAVLVRGVWVLGHARPILGPGRVSRALDVTLADHGCDCCGGRFAVSTIRRTFELDATTRIGISRGTEHPWRFVVRDLSNGRKR